jgi:hypothetical protein
MKNRIQASTKTATLHGTDRQLLNRAVDALEAVTFPLSQSVDFIGSTFNETAGTAAAIAALRDLGNAAKLIRAEIKTATL